MNERLLQDIFSVFQMVEQIENMQFESILNQWPIPFELSDFDCIEMMCAWKIHILYYQLTLYCLAVYSIPIIHFSPRKMLHFPKAIRIGVANKTHSRIGFSFTHRWT